MPAACFPLIGCSTRSVSLHGILFAHVQAPAFAGAARGSKGIPQLRCYMERRGLPPSPAPVQCPLADCDKRQFLTTLSLHPAVEGRGYAFSYEWEGAGPRRVDDL